MTENNTLFVNEKSVNQEINQYQESNIQPSTQEMQQF